MRNPLSAILICSDDIRDTLAQHDFSESDRAVVADCIEAANNIALCVQHQKSIVDDILTVSKLDSNLLLITPVPTQPLAVVERALAMFRPEVQAKDIVFTFQPDQSVADLRKRLGQDRKKAGPTDISPRLFEDCVEMYEGYGNVDKILKDCERIGMELKKSIGAWTRQGKGKGREDSPALRDLSDDGALSFVSLSNSTLANSLLTRAPTSLAKGVTLKDYQLTGINWLRLLHSKGYSCILADEMGRWHNSFIMITF